MKMTSKLQKFKLAGCAAALALSAALSHSAVNGAPAMRATTRPDLGNQSLPRFTGGQITVAHFEAAIANKDPVTRRRLAKTDGRMSFLHELENYDLLALEAERRGYAKHPAVIDAQQRVAVDA